LQAVFTEPEEGSGGGAQRVGDAHARAILDAALNAVITIDHRGHVLEFNRAAERAFGYRRADIVGLELAELIVPPELRAAHRAALQRWTEQGPREGAGAVLGRRLEVTAMRSDGSTFPAELAVSRVDIPGPPLFTACIRDLTESKDAEQADTALRVAETRFRTLVEQLPLVVYIDRLDESSSNIYSSPQIESLLGYTPEEWASEADLFVSVLHPDDREQVLAAHASTHATGAPLQLEYRLIARDGRVVWVHDEARVIDGPDGIPVLQGYLLEITEQRQAEEHLRHQAFHDALTGLANRALFMDRVQHALDVRSDARGDAAVLILDLDDFKAINDSLGHAAGDALLEEVGRRLRTALSASHTVARMGGDEFAILVEDPAGVPTSVAVAERLLSQFELPFHLDGREVFVTASVGVAVGRDGEELLRSADVALYRAKTGGGAQYAVYGPKMDEDVLGRLELISDLRRAQVEEEFVVHYQPIVELATGRLISIEALARWEHPKRGILQPSEFIPLAEETGRIVEIGRWVLAEACRQAAEWKSVLPSRAPFAVSVNVSTRQIRRHGIVNDIESALSGSGLEPTALTVEITESVFAERRDELVDVLDDVSGLGVALALDDFGAGYSSLPLLQDLPVAMVKIDRHFVDLIGRGLERAAFVRAIVDLARALSLQVVAEGIEHPAQVAALCNLGCRLGQGFHYAQPLAPAELGAILATGTVPRFPGALGTERAKVA
jgi:diguanylate cyclase (GGDEF)-like protein/PAS domain S-box-containing protein